MNRRSISQKLRFEIFEQNNFICQYCGRSPQTHDCTLQVDHIVSVKNGGTNERENLITSCWDCNIGKGAKTTILPILTDIDKERELSLARERLAQVIAVNEYQKKINATIQEIEINQYAPIEAVLVNFSEEAVEKIKKAFVKNVGIIPIDSFIESIKVAESKTKYVDEFMKYFNTILKQKRLEVENPELAEQNKQVNYFIYDMARNYNYVNRITVRRYIQEHSLETVKELYENSRSWSVFNSSLQQLNQYD